MAVFAMPSIILIIFSIIAILIGIFIFFSIKWCELK